MELSKKIDVLIAEDDFLISQMITESLKLKGYNIKGHAYNGIEAIKLTEKLNPDIIIMDIKMPKMDGFEASNEIFSKHPTPIIILSGYNSSEFINKACDSNICSYLTKPIDIDSLDRSIKISISRFKRSIKLHKENKKLNNRILEFENLNGWIPICSKCKKIRIEKNKWIEIEQFLQRYSDAQFTHSLCSECIEILYPDVYKKRIKKNNIKNKKK